jgi:hypothetical protein
LLDVISEVRARYFAATAQLTASGARRRLGKITIIEVDRRTSEIVMPHTGIASDES